MCSTVHTNPLVVCGIYCVCMLCYFHVQHKIAIDIYAGYDHATQIASLNICMFVLQPFTRVKRQQRLLNFACTFPSLRMLKSTSNFIDCNLRLGMLKSTLIVDITFVHYFKNHQLLISISYLYSIFI